MTKNEFDPRGRRMLVIANALLAVGASMLSLATAASEHLRPAIHAVAGFCMGLSISMNLHVLWRKRRRRTGEGSDGPGDCAV